MGSLNRVTVLYGSQTGNSEDVAERIGRVIIRMGGKSYVSNFKDYSVSQLINENCVVFVCSTTGNGEFPDDMKIFWRFLLRKELPRTSLCHLQFCVFGLGDSSYEKFNVVAKKLNKRLLQLGAVEIFPLTLADDQHELGYDAALDLWIQNLKNKLKELLNLISPFSDDSLLPSKYKVRFLEHVISNQENVNRISSDNLSLSLATLKANDRITSTDHFQAVHLLKFGVDSAVHYDPGDVAVVWPENPIDEVEDFISLLNVPLDTKFILIPTDDNVPLPKIKSYPCTVRQCVLLYFDIMCIPKKSFFEFFCNFSEDDLEKEKLLEFISAAGQEELYSYCNRPRRTILEVLKDFPHTTSHVPFEYFFDMIPCIRPRSFSIASSLCCHPNEFHLVVAVVQYKTRLHKPRKGLCSNWFANLPVGTMIPFDIKKGSITLHLGIHPIIMVGPGTGYAPFRSFIERRICDYKSENYLFFGCRYQSKDFLFEDEWKRLIEKKSLTLFTAFSRDQEEKIYVQHKILENSKLIWHLIHKEGAFIYVAGNAKQMPLGVKDAFINIIEKEGNLDHNTGLAYFQTLMQQKRYQTETWA